MSMFLQQPQLLSGILQCLQIPDQINNVMFRLMLKIGPEGVRQKLKLWPQDDMIERIFNLYDNKQIDLDYFSDNFPTVL